MGESSILHFQDPQRNLYFKVVVCGYRLSLLGFEAIMQGLVQKNRVRELLSTFCLNKSYETKWVSFIFIG